QLAAIYHGQGRLHEQQEHYAQALEAYQQALQVLDAEREPQGYAVVLHNIGNVYRAQQDLEQALSYYQQAAAFKERGGKPGDLVTSLRAQAAVQLELGQEQEALHIYERCVQLLQELPAPGAPEQLAAIYHRQGRLHEQQGHYAQALEAHQQAHQVFDAEREPQSYAVVLHNIGNVYRAQQDLE